MAVEIRTRYSTGTYVASAKGYKVTASNTISARQAAEALARKLGLNPAMLRETQRDLLRSGVELFIHPEEASTDVQGGTRDRRPAAHARV